jgi:hypothetical protein
VTLCKAGAPKTTCAAANAKMTRKTDDMLKGYSTMQLEREDASAVM